MQYANDSDLKNCLRKHYKNLTWDNKKKLAFQIADCLNYLHHENILHRDLLIIHDDNAKITDFCISKNMNAQNTTIHIRTFGRIPYVDPNKLKDLNFQYEKASDIYSYVDIVKNAIEETPNNYEKLYKKCWDSISKNQPNVEDNLTYENSNSKEAEINNENIPIEEIQTNELNCLLDTCSDLSSKLLNFK
ncbi:13350_t:CDS:2 [Funneliformis mosseae]|uniref:13350_t:CDS:1 n=1 Tax=Funneliformis mosseae TaxID=27381 RepID=A0A9N9DR06_FUNMO|nr:13350_t:CDS:2 [Funneliformis mosseae]